MSQQFALWDKLGIEEVKKAYNPKICLLLDQNNFQRI